MYYIKGNQWRKGSIYPSAYSSEAYEAEIEQVVSVLKNKLNLSYNHMNRISGWIVLEDAVQVAFLRQSF